MIGRTLWFLVLLASIRLSAAAQDSAAVPATTYLDLSGGLGAVEALALSFEGELRLLDGHDLFTAQAIVSTEFVPFPISMVAYPQSRNRFFGLSCLVGQSTTFRLKRHLFPFFPFALLLKSEADYAVSASIGVGVAYAHLRRSIDSPMTAYEQHDRFSDDRHLAVFFPVQAEIVQYIDPAVGYVHRFYYIFNARDRIHSWGILWGLQFNLTE